MLSKEAYTRHLSWKAPSRRSGEGQYVNIDDIRMYFEIYGGGEPVLLLHGSLGFIESFYNQIPDLAKEFCVIAADSRGHGRTTDSDKPLSYALMASDMIKLLDHLEMDSTHVVGWSAGAAIGIDLAINHPSRIRKLVAIGAHFSAEGLSDALREFAQSLTVEALRRRDHFRAAIDFYKKMAPDPSHLPILLEKMKHMWLIGPNHTLKELGSIRAQTLVLSGENDEFIRLDHVRELYQAIPNAHLKVIPDTGHFLPLESPKLVTEEIIDFLKTRH